MGCVDAQSYKMGLVGWEGRKRRKGDGSLRGVWFGGACAAGVCGRTQLYQRGEGGGAKPRSRPTAPPTSTCRPFSQNYRVMVWAAHVGHPPFPVSPPRQAPSVLAGGILITPRHYRDPPYSPSRRDQRPSRRRNAPIIGRCITTCPSHSFLHFRSHSPTATALHSLFFPFRPQSRAG
jgi:hypothetical protein